MVEVSKSTVLLYLKHVLQTCRLFLHYMRRVSKDVCHLLSAEMALLSKQPRHSAHPLHWKRQDPRVVTYHPLQTPWQTETEQCGMIKPSTKFLIIHIYKLMRL